ncbi:4-oxalocrotonate tautomerase family protein [Rhodovarius sp.]|jgi:4-oxalocrotonate tautomerase|uniref:tautomerase family protein n=1 Tax=Rhodovarius sp. TaxID=2972673 RepID=UPI00333F445B
MPLVQIRWFPGRSAEQKQALATRITQAFGEVVGSAPDHVSIIFEEVAREDWYEAGQPGSAPLKPASQ